MRSEIIRKLDKIHDGILKAHGGNVQLLRIIIVAGNFINYYVQKGEIYESERAECFEYISNMVYFKYNCTMHGAIKGWVYFMEDLNNTYEEETIRKYRRYIE